MIDLSYIYLDFMRHASRLLIAPSLDRAMWKELPRHALYILGDCKKGGLRKQVALATGLSNLHPKHRSLTLSCSNFKFLRPRRV